MNIPYIDTYINKIDNIESVLANKNIEVKKDGPYMLLKYGITADFSDAVLTIKSQMQQKLIGLPHECRRK